MPTSQVSFDYGIENRLPTNTGSNGDKRSNPVGSVHTARVKDCLPDHLIIATGVPPIAADWQQYLGRQSRADCGDLLRNVNDSGICHRTHFYLKYREDKPLSLLVFNS